MRFNLIPVLSLISEHVSGTVVHILSRPGFAIPLFEEGKEGRDPVVWFALSFSSDSMHMFEKSKCPFLANCELAQTFRNRLVLGDGTPLGSFDWQDGSRLNPELNMNVVGKIGLSPASPIAQSHVIYLRKDEDSINGLTLSLLRLPDPRWSGAHFPLGTDPDTWSVETTLSFGGKGKETLVGSSRGSVTVDLSKYNVVIPFKHKDIFNRGIRLFGASMMVEEMRLFYSCKRLEANGGVAFSLTLGGTVEVPIVGLPGYERIGSGKLCITNLEFTTGDTATIGRSLLKRNDIALDAKNGLIHFIAKESERRPVMGPITFVQPPPVAFRLDIGSIRENEYGASWRWIPSNGRDWEDFIFVTNPMSPVNGLLTIRCLKFSCRHVMKPLQEVIARMEGKLEVQLESDQSLVVTENRKTGRRNVRIIYGDTDDYASIISAHVP